MANMAPVGQVKLQLTTSDESLALPEKTGPILVNTSLRRIDLSRLVNHLREASQPPLEFIINGQFLRTSLDEFLTSNGISSETLLTVEYVRATVPPVHVASYLHDDWVAAVDVSSSSPGQERILSGCLDGRLRVWDMSNQVLATSAANENAVQGYRGIKTAKWVSPTQLVSGGYDQVVRLWNYEDSPSAGQASIKPHLELYGHRHAVLSVAAHALSQRVLSASADHTVCLWSTKRAGAPEADEKLIPRSNKRQKLSSTGPGIHTAQRGPLVTLKGHTDQATSTAFHPNDSSVAYSAGYDRTMRTWDLVTGSLVDTRTLPGGQAVSAMCPTQLTDRGLVACGTMGRGINILLVDPRAGATSTVAMGLRGHTNPVSSIATDPSSEYGLLSSSFDSTCKIWDLRNAKAGESGTVSESVYTISRETKQADNKVLDVCWDETVGIVAGGEDMRIQINKGTAASP